MFASTVCNKSVAISQPISPQKQMIEFKQVPIKQLYHLSIFMLPNVQFDPDYTALVYYQIAPENPEGNVYNNNAQMMQSDFKLLGFLNDVKQSAIFKINPGNIDTNKIMQASTQDEGDIDMESGISEIEERETISMIIGISIEPNQSATQQLDCLRVTRDNNVSNNNPIVKSIPSTQPVQTQSNLYVMSNKIIGNAYNYLSSFTDENNKVSITKFNNWWDKFKAKMNNDPNYLQTLED